METVKHVPPQQTQPLEARPQSVVNTQPVLRKFDSPKSNKGKSIVGFIVIGLIVVLSGVGTGKLLAQTTGKDSSSTAPKGAAVGDSELGADKEVGIETENSQSAEGTLKEGGKDGDGTHHLDRDLGEAKNIYLTSTVIDLQRYVGKKVQITGETISGQKAGWLMDVTKIKVIE